jgi:ketosteroid isomerase-like protein
MERCASTAPTNATVLHSSYEGKINMAITLDRVREIFEGLENGDGAAFFEHVADNVDWIVEGTHPLAGHYTSKSDFRAHTFEKLNRVLPQGTQLRVEHALAGADWAAVELHSLATARNGLRFDNRYCWVCRFAAGKIIEVRAYLDSALVARLSEENPIPGSEEINATSLARCAGVTNGRH